MARWNDRVRAKRAAAQRHYGNWAPNPAAMLAVLLSRLRDTEGRILIPVLSERPALGRRAPSAGRNPSWTRTCGGLRPGLERSGKRCPQRTHPAAGLNIRAWMRVTPAARPKTPFRPKPGHRSIFACTPSRPRRHPARREDFIPRQDFHIVRDIPDPQTRAASRIIACNGDLDTCRRARPWIFRSPGVIDTLENGLGEGVVKLPSVAAASHAPFSDALNAPVIVLPIANHDNGQHGPTRTCGCKPMDGIRLFAILLTDMGANWK